jgi:hypothetical protein
MNLQPSLLRAPSSIGARDESVVTASKAGTRLCRGRGLPPNAVLRGWARGAHAWAGRWVPRLIAGGYACGRVEEVREEGEDVGGRRGGRLDLSLVHGAYPNGIVQELQGIAHREWGRRTKVASSTTMGARTPCRSVRKLGLGNFAVISWARFWRHLAW